MISVSPLPLEWMPSAEPGFDDRLAAILKSWRGTPYLPGQNTKGAGVDCIHFVTSVLDELHGGLERESLLRFGYDTALRDPIKMRSFMRYLIERYGLQDCGDADFARPGDILAVGVNGPEHAIIVGPRRNTLWETCESGVIQTGWYSQLKLFSIYQVGDRPSWTRSKSS